MLTVEQRINAFVRLGAFMEEYRPDSVTTAGKSRHLIALLGKSIEQSLKANPWFISQHIDHALFAIAKMLNRENLEAWISRYQSSLNQETKINIGVIMAGNIPAVGFHDFFCVLMSGARFTGKLSSDDLFLLPALAETLRFFEPAFSENIKFTTTRNLTSDAIIATGSNNTARYFEHQYGHLPHLFRRNRNGVAILTGKESVEQLTALAQDVFLHFGFGCRNVSKMYVPHDYNFFGLMEAFSETDYVAHHQHFMNSYRHVRALLRLQEVNFIENNFVILLENPAIASPVATIHYEHYNNIEELYARLALHQDQIQCVVGEPDVIPGVISFGETQQPQPGDYADGVDTMEFLIEVPEKVRR
jgi:hypothetical protein